MKQIEFSNKIFTVVEGSKSEEYADYVSLTAKLLNKPYMTVHRIFEREQWPLEKIKTRYHECSKLEGKWKQIMWWSKRKKDNATNLTTK